MSLWGRYMIDRMKNAVAHRVTLPVPPYGSTSYWDKVYKTLGPEDVYEWGGLTLGGDLMHHKCRLLHEFSTQKTKNQGDAHDAMIQTSFGQVIGVDENEKEAKSICLLGCGNSKFGEEMAQEGWRGPLIQVDVATHVLETMSQRCASLVDQGIMNFVQDDATQLSAFDDNTMDAVIDKGLVDALFCANEFEQVQDVMNSVHRVLKPGSIFCVFSFSSPQYILPKMFLEAESGRQSKQWQSVQVRELESILMYRYQKHGKKVKRIKQHPRSRTKLR